MRGLLSLFWNDRGDAEDEDLKRINDVSPPGIAAGQRYPAIGSVNL